MKRGGLSQAALCALLSALLVLTPRTALALGPFEKNHPRVEEGMQAYESGRFDDALTAFEAARRELPENAVVEFDRGNALYKLQRLDEAREAYHRVADLDRGDLQEKDYYNLGNALAELNQPKDAIAAYRKALLLDPRDDLARHNLEVVLRNLPKPKRPQQQPDGGQDAGQDAGRDAGQDGGQQGKDSGQDGGGQGGSDGGQGDGGMSRSDGGTGMGPGDGGTDGGQGEDSSKKPDQEQKDAGSGPQDEPDQDEGSPDGGTDQQPMQELNKKDVERLLDSMKQSEKNLQLWRFQQRKSSKSRKDNATKDW
jgi:tetratricopeptide (TPR) repeat protein